MDYNFPVTRTTTPKEKPTDESSLGFGKYFTDHMFMMDYDEGQGWHDGRIIPYGPICFDPGSTTLHYGQMMFEGLKAYRNPEGTLNLFRPDMNAKRLNRTNEVHATLNNYTRQQYENTSYAWSQLEAKYWQTFGMGF